MGNKHLLTDRLAPRDPGAQKGWPPPKGRAPSAPLRACVPALPQRPQAAGRPPSGPPSGGPGLWFAWFSPFVSLLFCLQLGISSSAVVTNSCQGAGFAWWLESMGMRQRGRCRYGSGGSGGSRETHQLSVRMRSGGRDPKTQDPNSQGRLQTPGTPGEAVVPRFPPGSLASDTLLAPPWRSWAGGPGGKFSCQQHSGAPSAGGAKAPRPCPCPPPHCPASPKWHFI